MAGGEVHRVSRTFPIGPRGRPPVIREDRLLDAARDVFREEGHAATTARIARRAGVSEGILYYRYRSREALLAAVIRRETEPPEALRRLAAAAGQASVAENLTAMLRALVEGVSRAHPFVELAEASPASAAIRKALAGGGRPAPARLVRLVARYLWAEIRLGRVRRVDPLPLARALLGGCIEHVRSRASARPRDGDDAFVLGLVDVILSGVTPVPPSPASP
jgi:AcrR family transcriptional regulator